MRLLFKRCASAAASLLSLPFYAKVVLAILLGAAYVLFIRQTVKAGGGRPTSEPDLVALIFKGPTWAVAAQVVVTIAVMGVGPTSS